MRVNQSTEAIVQNLKDAGCNQDTIERIMTDFKTGEVQRNHKNIQ